MRFAIFPRHLSKLLRLQRKSDAKSYEVLRLSRKTILANLTLMLQNATPLTSLMNMCLLYCACHTKCIFADPLQMPFETATKPSRFAHF